LKIIIPLQIKDQLVAVLTNAGDRETGGIVMGEHVGIDEFLVKEITVEPKLGTFASFLRSLSHALSSLNRFFQRTQYNYIRYNYMGEWHSHPCFPTTPSSKDISTMVDAINDKKIGANFLVLLIFKLNISASIESTATVFSPDRPYATCDLVFLDI
jgi:proteasome lid subunit RPN8/RPN11